MMLVKESDLVVDAHLAKSLSDLGIARIPFLSTAELYDVVRFYQDIHCGKNPRKLMHGINMSIWDDDQGYKETIRKELHRLLLSACQRCFNNFRSVGEQFVVKLACEGKEFALHQDWSIVDESKYVSLNVWIPLQNVNQDNGGLCAVEKSHRLKNTVRGAGILFPDFSFIGEEHLFVTRQYELYAGEAMVFHHRTIHGSPPNISEDVRVAVQLAIVPREAPLEIYFMKDGGCPLEIHRPDDDFNLNYGDIHVESSLRGPTPCPQVILHGWKPMHVDRAVLSEVL